LRIGERIRPSVVRRGNFLHQASEPARTLASVSASPPRHWLTQAPNAGLCNGQLMRPG
jgi:hypothetical protein